MVPVNRRRLGDVLYQVALHQQRHFLYAESPNEARQRAIELFRPKKQDRDFITVTRSEKA